MEYKIITETERTTVREFVSRDLEDLFRLDGDPDVMRFIGDGRTQGYEQTRQNLASIIAQYAASSGYGTWAVNEKAGGKFIGWVCLKNLDNTEEIEIGYRLLKEFWKVGLATEVAREILRYGFEDLGLERIVAVANPENAASQKVLARIGLGFEKYAYHYKKKVAYFSVEKKDMAIFRGK